MHRRAMLTGAGALAACASSGAAAPSEDLSAYVIGAEPDEVLDLWPGRAPGGAGVALAQETVERGDAAGLRDRMVIGVTRPTLSHFRPARADGSAVLIIPGGGYSRVVVDKEGFETARWFSARGVHAFVVLYRLPADGWSAGADAPLEDAQRAMRLIRARAGAEGFDAGRIGAVGFSAGGHLAASLAARFDAATGAPEDGAAALSARPDVCCLMYPVITMAEPHAHMGSRTQLIGAEPSPQRIGAYSAENGARADMPPLMLIHAADDDVVPVQNSLIMYAAARRAGVAAELHLFEEGGHGFGLRGLEAKPARAWPHLFRTWGARHGVFSP